MRIFWATSLVLFLPATSVVADIYDDCQAAISEGNAAAVDEIANKLQRFNSLPQRSLTKAEACVSASVGVPMVYSSLGWIELSYREVLLATKAAEEAARLEAH